MSALSFVQCVREKSDLVLITFEALCLCFVFRVHEEYLFSVLMYPSDHIVSDFLGLIIFFYYLEQIIFLVL